MAEPILARRGINTGSEQRANPQLVMNLAVDPTTLVMQVNGPRVAVVGLSEELQFLPAVTWPKEFWENAYADGKAWYLGHDENHAYLGLGAETVVIPDPGPQPPERWELPSASAGQETRWVDLRHCAPHFTAGVTGLAVAASALHAWHENGRFCAKCGQLTQVKNSGWLRFCTSCWREVYPRQDPVVIMTVFDESNRLLLANNGMWPEKRYSIVAGYVEAGESAETAVRREVREECGLEVGDVSYYASQPWPFPRSLMLGFVAHLAPGSSNVPRPDGNEIRHAQFLSRQEVLDAQAAGEIYLPGQASIAHFMIKNWLDNGKLT